MSVYYDKTGKDESVENIRIRDIQRNEESNK